MNRGVIAGHAQGRARKLIIRAFRFLQADDVRLRLARATRANAPDVLRSELMFQETIFILHSNLNLDLNLCDDGPAPEGLGARLGTAINSISTPGVGTITSDSGSAAAS